MMSEFELTPLNEEEHEVSHYGSKVNNTGICNNQLFSKDGGQTRNDLRILSTRIVMKRKQKWCRSILLFLVVLLILIICLLLGFYLNETKNRQSETNNIVPTHVSVKPIPPKSAIYIKRFKSFIYEKDSRIFETVFSNGTYLKVFGMKDVSSDNFKIESLYLSHIGHDDEIRIRFGAQNKMAYVLLGKIAQVNYEWSRDLTSLDLKVYLSSPMDDLDANSYIFTVKLLEYASLLQIIFKTLAGKSMMGDFPINLRKRYCVSYLPLRVTKCGSKNIYNSAFLEGKIKSGNSHMIITALPWPIENDECFKPVNDKGLRSNFYIPLPSDIVDEPSCNTATKYFMQICAVIPVEIPSYTICYNISHQINHSGERELDKLVNIIFKSCVSILSSLVLMCSSLQTDYKPYMESHSPNFILSDSSIRDKLCSSSKISKQSTPNPLTLSVLAFCPTEAPITSADQVIYFNQSMTVGNTIHINCRGPPEITLYQLAHTYTGNGHQLTTLKHNFRICAKCAFETVATIRVLDNEVCCQNVCSKDNTSICALGRLGVEEKFQFTSHGGLYCHNFLESQDSDTSALNVQCVGHCVNYFTVDFKMSNFREQEIFYHQPIMCRGSNSQTCNSKFGT